MSPTAWRNSAGSYVLALPSYNAGPGRTRQWIKEFGDPRDRQVDPIDWIERIPIEETRRYVHKVLSNIQIYRARLGEEARPCGWMRIWRAPGVRRSCRPRPMPRRTQQPRMTVDIAFRSSVCRAARLCGLAPRLRTSYRSNRVKGRASPMTWVLATTFGSGFGGGLAAWGLTMTATAPFEDIYFTSRDGLRLHARRYPAVRHGSTRPLLCLAGLTRNGRDFHDLAVALANAQHAAHRLHARLPRPRAVRFRSRLAQLRRPDRDAGRDRLHDAERPAGRRHYRHLAGGLITMLLAAAQPTTIGAVVLNDIGPVIEHEGLARISGYVGRVPLPFSWPDAARMVRDLNSRHFPRDRGGMGGRRAPVVQRKQRQAGAGL